MNQKPGIFNDVIGPIMRGPSSSHTAASWRAAKMCLDILNEPLKSALIDFDKDDAWAPNYREQGTVLGIEGGLLNLEMTDDRMKDTEKVLDERGIDVKFEVNSFETSHVNTFRLRLVGINGKTITVIAVSLGGGSVEIRSINGFAVTLGGGFYDLLLTNNRNDAFPEILNTILPAYKEIKESFCDDKRLINVKLSSEVSDEIISELEDMNIFDSVVLVRPVLPIITGLETELPFSTVASMLEYAEQNDLDLADIGITYECAQSGLEEKVIIDKMTDLVGIINNSIKVGLAGTHYDDRILPQQSHLIEKASKRGRILQNSIMNKIIANVSAIMESKSALEVVVANPTAGSCGTVGGVLRAVADDIDATNEELVRAYFAAGAVGAYFAMGPGFSAEEHGCQVECGASAGMAAAGIVQLFGGTARQAVDAASMSIQNMIGLVCDPIADRVEAPCLGKNISAAVNALSMATMSTSGFLAVIPLNEVLETVSNVSKQMPTCLKCTGKGGLAMTKTAQELKAMLALKSKAVTTN